MSISRADLVRHMAEVHRGSNLVISAAGAVTEREEEILASAFHFPPGVPVSMVDEPALPQPSPGRWTYPKDLGQVYLEIGIPAVGMNHPDRYGIVLLANLLGGGMSSRLFQRVREEQALAYSIYTWTDFHVDTGCLCTSLSASPEKGPRALALVAQEYQRLRAGELEDEEIEMNRNQVLASMVLGLEGSMHQASRQARSEIFYGRFVPVEEMIEQLHAVSRDDLVRIAESFLDPALQTVVGHGPTKELVFG
jgi:predicted Zn-dependent peptidase